MAVSSLETILEPIGSGVVGKARGRGRAVYLGCNEAIWRELLARCIGV